MSVSSPAADPGPRQILISLAGHIDHGKSSLVARLTGKATDRRPEEQRRGMTVDLGFTHCDIGSWRFALIDVPGHDRFVHNMVHGAAGVHFGMLVVAADDSVMPQTREHLDVLDLLGVSGGVVVITKCDLVDDEWIEEVRNDIRDLVSGTTFEAAPIATCSTVTGEGVSDLRHTLVALAEGASLNRDQTGPFRISIDRSFSLAGHGTVVTGTVRRGTVATGDSLMLLPQRDRVRVRRLQRQGEDVDAVNAGDRAAINLAGIKAGEVNRGDELVAEGCYELTRRLLIHLRVLPHAGCSVSDREEVRVHVGTREVTGRVRLSTSQAAPGQQVVAVLDCYRPVVGEFDQPVILRRLSPATTLAGGRILLTRWRSHQRLQRLMTLGRELASDEITTRLHAFLELAGPTDLSGIEPSIVLGCGRTKLMRSVDTLSRHGEVIRIAGESDLVLTRGELEHLTESVHKWLKDESRRIHPRRWIPFAQLTHRFQSRYVPRIVGESVNTLADKGSLRLRDQEVALAADVNLSRRQRQLLETVAADIDQGGTAPPTLKELADRHGSTVKELEPLVDLLVEEGSVVSISPDLVVSAGVLPILREGLRQKLSQQREVTVAEVRDLWQVTRKHALPYLQYFDEQQDTQRSGTVRVAGPSLFENEPQGRRT